MEPKDFQMVQEKVVRSHLANVRFFLNLNVTIPSGTGSQKCVRLITTWVEGYARGHAMAKRIKVNKIGLLGQSELGASLTRFADRSFS